MNKLLAEIERVLPDGGQWCSLEKAQTLAALIVGLKPKLVVEIGVWSGGSCVPLLLALKHNGVGRAIAIDPWDASASVANEAPANVKWWGETIGQDGHDDAMNMFISRIRVLKVTNLCEIWRKRSDDCDPPDDIGLLHVDGSHTDQAIRDVQRFASKVIAGGILVLDDLHWEGSGVERAYDLAVSLGFEELYKLGTGCVMQRRGKGTAA